MFKLRKKDFLQVSDLTLDEGLRLFELARELKARRKRGEQVVPVLNGKSLGMLFAKPSTRTRISFEVAMLELGGHVLNLSPEGMQISRGETMADTGRVLSRYLQGIMIRTFHQEDVVELARNTSIPVINGLTDSHHPCQALADFFTIWERKNSFKGVKLAYFGDVNNVCRSLVQAAALFNVEMTVAAPASVLPGKEMLAGFSKDGMKKITFTSNPKTDLSGTDFVYTDVWISMGEEKSGKNKKMFQPYQLNQALLNSASSKIKVMHCLPAHRGEEITDEVIDGPHSIVWEQAENRLHFQKALLAALF